MANLIINQIRLNNLRDRFITNIPKSAVIFKIKQIPNLPVNAKTLMSEHNIPEGREIGKKLKIIEQEWVKNNFELSDIQIKKIIKN